MEPREFSMDNGDNMFFIDTPSLQVDSPQSIISNDHQPVYKLLPPGTLDQGKIIKINTTKSPSSSNATMVIESSGTVKRLQKILPTPGSGTLSPRMPMKSKLVAIPASSLSGSVKTMVTSNIGEDKSKSSGSMLMRKIIQLQKPLSECHTSDLKQGASAQSVQMVFKKKDGTTMLCQTRPKAIAPAPSTSQSTSKMISIPSKPSTSVPVKTIPSVPGISNSSLPRSPNFPLISISKPASTPPISIQQVGPRATMAGVQLTKAPLQLRIPGRPSGPGSLVKIGGTPTIKLVKPGSSLLRTISMPASGPRAIVQPLKGYNVTIPGKSNDSPIILTAPSSQVSNEMEVHAVNEQGAIDPSEMFVVNETDKTGPTSSVEVVEIHADSKSKEKLTNLINACLTRFTSLVQAMSVSLSSAVEMLASLLTNVLRTQEGMVTLVDKVFLGTLKRHLQGVNLHQHIAWTISHMNVICANLKLEHIAPRLHGHVHVLNSIVEGKERREKISRWSREVSNLSAMCDAAVATITDSKQLRVDLQACFVKVTSFMKAVLDEMKRDVLDFASLIKSEFGVSLVKKLTDRYPEKEIYRMFLSVNKTKGKIERIYREIMNKKLLPTDVKKFNDSQGKHSSAKPVQNDPEFDLLCEELEQKAASPTNEEPLEKDESALVETCPDKNEASPDKNETSFSDSLNEFVISSEEEETEEVGGDKPVGKIYMSDFEQFVQKYRTTLEPEASRSAAKPPEQGSQDVVSAPEVEIQGDSDGVLSSEAEKKLYRIVNIETVSLETCMLVEETTSSVTGVQAKEDTIETLTNLANVKLTTSDCKVGSKVTRSDCDNSKRADLEHMDTSGILKLDIRRKSSPDAVSIEFTPAKTSHSSLGSASHHSNSQPVVHTTTSSTNSAHQASISSSQPSAHQTSTSAHQASTSAHQTSTSSHQASTSAHQTSTSAHQTSTSAHQASISSSQHSTSAHQTSTSAPQLAATSNSSPSPSATFKVSSTSNTPADTPTSLLSSSLTSSGNVATSSVNVVTSSANVATSSSNVATSSVNAVTSSGNVATSSSNVVTSSVNVVTSSANVATSSSNVATSSVNAVTSLGNVATSSANVATSEAPSSGTSQPPAKNMFEELKKYTRELFTREQESLNNILSKSGKLTVRTSANVGPAQKSPRIDETETKTTEDEITILDDKQIDQNSDSLKILNVQKINDLSCDEVFLEENGNQQKTGSTKKFSDSSNFIKIYDVAKVVAHKDDSPVNSDSESPKGLNINRGMALGKKQSLAERRKVLDELSMCMLQPHENLEDPEVKRRLKIYKDRWMSQQRDQALETACLKGMKAQALGFRPKTGLLPSGDVPDVPTSASEDAMSGRGAEVEVVKPFSNRPRDSRKSIRPLSQGEVMGNRDGPGSQVFRDTVGNRVYSEDDFYPCCFKLKSKVPCTCPQYVENTNKKRPVPSDTLSNNTKKRKKEIDSPAQPEKKRKNQAKSSQESGEKIYCCRSCGCYGDLNDFITVDFCSVECRDIKPSPDTIALLKSPGKGKHLEAMGKETALTKSPRKEKTGVEQRSLTANYVAIASLWSWKDYYSSTGSRPAPLRAFRNEPPAIKPHPNPFKVGQKLEAKDPQMESRICVVSVVELRGPRIRCHFDGYPDRYDFWVNANSPDLYPAGWNAQFHRRIVPPCKAKLFSWKKYLKSTNAQAAPENCFTCSHMPPSVFKINHKLEALNKKSTNQFHVATVKDVIGPRVHIHLDGLPERLDYWTDIGTAYIQPVGWCRRNGIKLMAPPVTDMRNSSFSWDTYLTQTNSIAVPEEGFLQVPMLNSFERGQKVEAVDPRVPSLIRVATVVDVEDYRIKISVDGFEPYVDYWVYYDSVNVHPPGWCKRTGHPLDPPVGGGIQIGDCGTPGCAGRGHTEWAHFQFHFSSDTCPYSRLNIAMQHRTVWTRLDEKIESVIAPMSEKRRLIRDAVQEDIDCGSPSYLLDDDSSGFTSSQVSQVSSRRESGSDEDDESDSEMEEEELNVETISGRDNGSKKMKRALQHKGSQSKNPYNLNFLPIDKKTQARIDELREAVIRSVYSLPPDPQDLATMYYWRKNLDHVTSHFNVEEKGDPAMWTENDVMQFVGSIPGCEPSVKAFEKQKLDGIAFLLLARSDLTRYLHLKLGHAAKIFGAIVELRQRTKLMEELLFAPLKEEKVKHVLDEARRPDNGTEMGEGEIKIEIKIEESEIPSEKMSEDMGDSKTVNQTEVSEAERTGDAVETDVEMGEDKSDERSEKVADESDDRDSEQRSEEINSIDKIEEIEKEVVENIGLSKVDKTGQRIVESIDLGKEDRTGQVIEERKNLIDSSKEDNSEQVIVERNEPIDSGKVDENVQETVDLEDKRVANTVIKDNDDTRPVEKPKSELEKVLLG